MSEQTSFFEIDAKMEILRELLDKADEETTAQFDAALDLSWIYHDNALEGVVLHFHELKAAVDSRIISDTSLIPMYDEICAHKAGIDLVRDLATRRKVGIDLNTIKLIHQTVTIDLDGRQYHYRKENPLHRLYFHEIVTPEKISYKLRKLIDWAATQEFRKMHPVRRATAVHYYLISIYPWMKNSGKVARLLMNLLLYRDGYLPAVIHAVERQRYYEVLRTDLDSITRLVVASLANGLDSATRFLRDEADPEQAFG
ncbi:MAG: Fic family protein [bacterium]